MCANFRLALIVLSLCFCISSSQVNEAAARCMLYINGDTLNVDVNVTITVARPAALVCEGGSITASVNRSHSELC
jgi:hypothetical protein